MQNSANEEWLNKNSKNIRANTEELAKHKTELENFNTFQQTSTRNAERLETKIQKNREHANDELKKVTNDIDSRINELDKIVSDNEDKTNNKFTEINKNQANSITNLKNELIKL